MSNSLIKASSIALVLSLFLVGCSSNPKPQEQKQESEKPNFACKQDGVLAPDFTCDPVSKGSIVALGVAKMNAGNDKAFQRTEAMSSARDALARQIEVKVSNLFKKYKATTGSGADSTFDKATSDVSRQLASQTLQNSKQIGKSWRHPKTHELFILVGVNVDDVAKKVEEATKTSFKNDKALYQQFLADKANGELDAELEKAGK